MKLTIIADSQSLLSSTERAVEEAGFSVLKALMLDKVSDCSDIGEDIGDSDAFIVACHRVDQQAEDLLCMITAHCAAPILLVSDDERDEAIQASVKCGASVYLVNCEALSRLAFLLRVAMVRHNQMQSLMDELSSAKSALEHRKLVEKAKGIIMKTRNIDEDSAYRAIRKLAMDNNQKMHDVANQIITAAEVLI